MVAFTGWSNEGVNSLANSLSGLGQSFGNAYLRNQQMQQERELLSDFGKKYTSGDFEGAMQSAIAMGKPELAIDIKSKIDQQAADSLAMAPISGVGASPANQATTPMNLAGGLPANDEIGSYIVQAAKARGIDPNIALQVYGSEGKKAYVGDDGSSFGPFQLHYGGVAKGGNAVPGLGDEFTKQTGLDARNPSTWRQQVDFSLDRAATGGWSPWHGWKGDPMAGIGSQPQRVQVADASGAIPQSANVDALIKKRDNIVRGLSMPGISNNARQSLSAQLQVVNSDIERADKVSQQPGMRVQAEADQRAALADRYNLTGEAKQQFVLTGKLPKEDQQLTAGDRDAIRTADENIQAANSVIGALTQAKSLSKQAWGFPGAGVAAKAGSLAGNETAIATTELDNLISGQALDSLRAIFGGNPTEGERKILLDIQGSSSQPDTVRQKIFDRAISAAQRRLQFNQDRANELRGGTYYKPRDGSQPQGSGNVTAAKPIPSNILEEARAAIPRKGREAVINLLRQQGFDTGGL